MFGRNRLLPPKFGKNNYNNYIENIVELFKGFLRVAVRINQQHQIVSDTLTIRVVLDVKLSAGEKYSTIGGALQTIWKCVTSQQSKVVIR